MAPAHWRVQRSALTNFQPTDKSKRGCWQSSHHQTRKMQVSAPAVLAALCSSKNKLIRHPSSPPGVVVGRPSSRVVLLRRRSANYYFAAMRQWILQRLGIRTTVGMLLLYSGSLIVVTRPPARQLVLGGYSATTMIEMNERTRGLLEILWSAEDRQQQQNDMAAIPPPWPSYLTLYSVDGNHPQISNQLPTRDNSADAAPPADDTTTTTSTSSNPNSNLTSACIVTAYFRIPSKHASETYENDWMAKMLGSISDCMVIFCEEHMAEKIHTYRHDHNNTDRPTTVIVTLRLADLPVAHYYDPHSSSSRRRWRNKTSDPSTDYWQRQFQLDPEQDIHRCYQLFWIWLSKSWFVSTAIALQPHLFPAERATTTTSPVSMHYWMWADIGSFREPSTTDQGRTRLIRHPEALLRGGDATEEDVVVWMAHQQPNPPRDPLWNNKLQQPHHFYQSGSHGFGTATAWMRFHAAFVTTLELYAGRFVGEDQCVLQSTCRLHPTLCAYVLHHQVPDNNYFGLRHVLRNGPDPKLNAGAHLLLWHPPPL